jgi:ribose 5-phosphate isomerase A
MGKDVSELKKEASAYAVDLVESGMVVGLGHGSTSIHAVGFLTQKLKTGALRNVKGVPCSFQVEEEALRYGMPLTKLEDISSIDLTIDGADEVDPNLNMIKGGGGALLREKIVAQISRREVIVVDESKLSPILGKKSSIPVEVIPFGWQFQHDFLRTLGATVTVRRNADKSLYQTDQGNLILDCNFGPIAQPQHLADLIRQRAGIVEHGLFLNLATDVIVAGGDGVRHLKREAK